MIGQEMHIYDENMLASRLFYFSGYVQEAWKVKAKAISEGAVYIGGV